jgi:putative ABC transport system permease protein
MRLFHAARTRMGLLFSRRDAESRMNDEMRFHIDMEAERLGRDEGLAPEEARRRAVIAFGIAEQHKDAMRDGRGVRWLGGYSLDFKLAFRMLVKYPGLSVVAVVGMAVAIAVGAGAFTFISALTDPSVPLHEGDRIVSIQSTDAKNPGSPERQALADFALWRGRLTRLRDMGAYLADERTVVYPDGNADLVKLAHITASGFRVARVAPHLGRTIIDDDEREGAAPVLVIAYEDWQRRFGGDPGVVGRTVKLGSADYTVVGVMPPGFRFPVNQHYWVALQLDPGAFAPGSGPGVRLFARLAPGATLEQAQAEIAAAGVAGRDRRPDLRPQVLPYTFPYAELDTPAMALAFYGLELAISLLLVVVAVNVSVLVYARTAARTGEIAVRTALGATRARVAAQLFAEALVLAGIAAVLGFALVRAGLAVLMTFQGRGDGPELPFWVDFSISPSAVLYVVGLTLLASVIVGVLPALKATGRNVNAGLKELSARGSRMQLGRTWTTLIVAQVALAVAVLPYASYVAGQSLQRGTVKPAFPVDEIIRAEVRLEDEARPIIADPEARGRAANALFLRRAEELVRRLEAEPAVAGVSFASHFPGWEELTRIEAEGGEARWADRSRVAPNLLDMLDVRVLAGRQLAPSDVPADARVTTAAGDPADDARAAVVNATLAEWLGATGGVLGRRIRVVRQVKDGDTWRTEYGPWIEVAGVMPHFTVKAGFGPADATFYLPTSLAGAVAGGRRLSVAVRVRGSDASTFASRFRAVAADLDPRLQLNDLRTAANLQWEEQMTLRLVGSGVAIVTLSVLLLSAAGIYAMMAFTVQRRRREIGIRAALGASARRVLGGIFAQASTQLGIGVLVGLVLAAVVNQLSGSGLLSGERLLLLPLAAVIMLVIGMLAALGPARRGLAVQPSEALREE